ncbi:hypothetical protein IMSAGC016_00221 [Muribaculaceae bacterium]|nr:hypothetical protein IMSAGC016_00221 [Muribaculaceae bacterium]
MPEKTTKRALFNIERGGIDQFAFFEDNYNVSADSLRLSSTVRFEYHTAKGMLDCECAVVGTQNGTIVLKASVLFTYGLAPETISDLSEDGSIVIPKQLLVYFASNTYGALRGVLLAKLENTPLRLILPAVNLAEIVKDSLSVRLS